MGRILRMAGTWCPGGCSERGLWHCFLCGFVVSLGHATCQGYGKHKGEFGERHSRFVIFIYLNTVCILCLYIMLYKCTMQIYMFINMYTANECMLFCLCCLWFYMWHLETLKSRGRKLSAFSKPFTWTTGRIQMNLLCSNIWRSSWSLGINWTFWMVLGHEPCWNPQWKHSRLRCVQTISKHLKIYLLWFKGIPNRSSAHRIICHIHTFAIY